MVYDGCPSVDGGRPQAEERTKSGGMRTEQKFTYLLDQSRLVGVLLLCVTGTLIACALIVAVQFWAEVRRRRQEARAAIARRLRYRKDMREVPVPKLGRCDFHCFLSHVWGTGQDQVRVTASEPSRLCASRTVERWRNANGAWRGAVRCESPNNG